MNKPCLLDLYNELIIRLKSVRDVTAGSWNTDVICLGRGTVRHTETFVEYCKWYFNTCTVHILLFYTMTNKCTIISQIITLLHVSTLSCHPQGALNQYLAKLTQVFYMQLLVKKLHLDCQLYYQQLHLKYLSNLARYWLQLFTVHNNCKWYLSARSYPNEVAGVLLSPN